MLFPANVLEDNDFYNLVHNHKNGTTFKAINQVKIPHFILVGLDRFRVETNHKQTKAIACFKNTTIGNILNNQFEDIIGDTKNMRMLNVA